jgi:hypothetical protein
LVQDEGGQGGNNRLGPNSTAFLIVVVFGSTLAFFGMTVRATVQRSLGTKGVVGKLAKAMAKCCRVEQEKENGGHRGEDGPPSLTRVVPVQVQQEGQEQQHKTTLRNEIIALKWQKNIRQTLMNNTDPKQSRVKRTQTWRTQRVEEIQITHQNHRELALKNIERQQSQRRSSLKLRILARGVKNQEEEHVTLNSVVLPGNETAH